MNLPRLLKDIRACTLCAAHLPCPPRPMIQAHAEARLCITGHAPGRKVHETGIPWNSPSGNRLRDWLGLTPQQFYDPRKVALVGMGFCYPGTGPNGDLPPRPECAPHWHEAVNAQLPNISLTLLIGTYALDYYLGSRRKATLQETVRAWREYLDEGYLPLVHPSPRNQLWLKKNPWFEKELLPDVKKIIGGMKL